MTPGNVSARPPDESHTKRNACNDDNHRDNVIIRAITYPRKDKVENTV